MTADGDGAGRAASTESSVDPFLRKAVEMLEAANVSWSLVSDPDALRPADLTSAAVGLVPTASASDEDVVDAVLRLLSGLGPISVQLRTMRTESYARLEDGPSVLGASDRSPTHA